MQPLGSVAPGEDRGRVESWLDNLTAEPKVKAVFAEADVHQEGKISFQRFTTWWAERMRAASASGANRSPEASLVATMRQAWMASTMENSDELTENQFVVWLHKVVTEQWREAVDEKTGREYYFNVTTHETRWEPADINSDVIEFCERHGIVADEQELSNPLNGMI